MGTKLVLVILVVALATIVQSAAFTKGKLRFKVSGRNLPDKDTGIGTTDGYYEVFFSEDGGKTRNKIGRSNVINDQENPNWGDIFTYDFDANKDQLLYFRVWDKDTVSSDENVGRVWISVRDYVFKGQIVYANLDKEGYLIIQSETPQTPPYPGVPLGTVPLPSGTAETQTLKFKVSGFELRTKDDVAFIPGKSDPYVIIWVAEGVSGKEKNVGRSGTLTGTSNPNWGDIFTVNWNYKKDQRLHFRLYDNDHLRSDDKLGSVWLELNDYVARGQSMTVNIPKGGKITVYRS